MAKANFRVRLRGRNFLLAGGEAPQRYKFHVTVFVCAQDLDSAREAAMRALGEDEDLVGAVCNAPDDPPLVFTIEVAAIPADLAPPPKRSAFELALDDGSEPEPGLPEEPVGPRGPSAT